SNGAPDLVPYAAGEWFPPGGHGTACATLAVGRGAGLNGCGAAPAAHLIPVACLHGDISNQGSIALAILYAAFPKEQNSALPAQQGADVVTCSLGPDGPTWTLTSVLDEAMTRVAAEGRG